MRPKWRKKKVQETPSPEMDIELVLEKKKEKNPNPRSPQAIWAELRTLVESMAKTNSKEFRLEVLDDSRVLIETNFRQLDEDEVRCSEHDVNPETKENMLMSLNREARTKPNYMSQQRRGTQSARKLGVKESNSSQKQSQVSTREGLPVKPSKAETSRRSSLSQRSSGRQSQLSSRYKPPSRTLKSRRSSASQFSSSRRSQASARSKATVKTSNKTKRQSSAPSKLPSSVRSRISTSSFSRSQISTGGKARSTQSMSNAKAKSTLVARKNVERERALESRDEVVGHKDMNSRDDDTSTPKWRTAIDPPSGKNFYYIENSRVSTWTKPRGFDAQNPDASHKWRTAVDPKTGVNYYFDRKSRVSTWTKPPDFDAQYEQYLRKKINTMDWQEQDPNVRVRVHVEDGYFTTEMGALANMVADLAKELRDSLLSSPTNGDNWSRASTTQVDARTVPSKHSHDQHPTSSLSTLVTRGLVEPLQVVEILYRDGVFMICDMIDPDHEADLPPVLMIESVRKKREARNRGKRLACGVADPFDEINFPVPCVGCDATGREGSLTQPFPFGTYHTDWQWGDESDLDLDDASQGSSLYYV